MKHQQLSQEIKKAEEHLASLRKQMEETSFPTIQEATVGDTLEDGSIVLLKADNHAIVVAPQSTEVEACWSREFSEVFEALKHKGFNPSQWFVPSKELLYLAYQQIPNHFQKRWYWSSSEFSASSACNVSFFNGNQCNIRKSNTYCVRAFRCVVF